VIAELVSIVVSPWHVSSKDHARLLDGFAQPLAWLPFRQAGDDRVT